MKKKTTHILFTQKKILQKIKRSFEGLDKITPHIEICFNEECVGENPICDHAKYMVKEITKHNKLVDKLKEKYLDKYPEAKNIND